MFADPDGQADGPKSAGGRRLAVGSADSAPSTIGISECAGPSQGKMAYLCAETEYFDYAPPKVAGQNGALLASDSALTTGGIL